MSRKVALISFSVLALLSLVFIFRYNTLNFGSKSYFTDKPINMHEIKETNKLKKTIVFSYGGNDVGGTVRKNVNLFQSAHPDIHIKLQQLPDSSDYQRNAYQIALLSGDDNIDVFLADIVWIAEFGSANWVMPLDKYFTPAMREEFLSNTIEACTYKGKIYAVPSRTDAPLLYYRTDIVSSPPKTYNELVDLARKYKNTPGIKYGYVFQAQTYEGLICNALEFIWGHGGEIIENGNVSINSPQALQGLQLFIDILNSDISSRDLLNFQEEDTRMAFQDGSAIFMRNWPYAYRLLNSESSKVKGKVGLAPLPADCEGKLGKGTLGGWNYMINKNSKNPDLAWEFVQWMSNYDTQVIDSCYGGYVPTRKAVYNNDDVKKSSTWISSYKNIFESAKLRPVSPYYSSITDSMQVNISSAIVGSIDTKTALENIENDLNRIRSKSGN